MQTARTPSAFPRCDCASGSSVVSARTKGIEALAAFARIATRLPNAVLGFLGSGGSEEAAITATDRNASVSRSDPPRAVSAPISTHAILPWIFSSCLPRMKACRTPSSRRWPAACPCSRMPARATKQSSPMATTAGSQISRDPAARGRCWKKSFSDPGALRAGGRTRRQTIESRFSLGQMVDAYEQLYRRLANSPWISPASSYFSPSTT